MQTNYTFRGAREKLSIKTNHHQTLETEQLGMGWCSLLSDMLALPPCNTADCRLWLQKWEVNHMPNTLHASFDQTGHRDSGISNFNVHPKHLFHWGTWAPHKTLSALAKFFLWRNCWYILAHFFYGSFETSSYLKPVMSRTGALTFFRASFADFMAFSFLILFFFSSNTVPFIEHHSHGTLLLLHL